MPGDGVVPGAITPLLLVEHAAEDHGLEHQWQAVAEAVVEAEKYGRHLDAVADLGLGHDPVRPGEHLGPRQHVLGQHQVMLLVEQVVPHLRFSLSIQLNANSSDGCWHSSTTSL